MKDPLMLIGVLLFSFALQAQTLVGTSPQNRKAVIEEFTRIHCGLCPAGNVIANNILNANPGEVILIGLHTGSLAVPNPGEPDFRTTEGEMIADHFGVNGTPKALVNRSPYNGSTVMGSSLWSGATQNVLQMQSPVNVGLMSEFDPVTRELTVTVEAYYTSDSPLPSNFIHVVFTESQIIGWQADYQNGNQPNYEHDHVFRASLAGTWGDQITSTTAGSLVTRTYTYTVPADHEIGNSNVIAFISEAQSGIYTGAEVVADGGTTATGVGIDEERLESVLGNSYPNPSSDKVFIPLVGLEEAATLRILDRSGRLVLERAVSNGSVLIELEVGELVSGVYAYQLIGVDGASFTRRMIVAH